MGVATLTGCFDAAQSLYQRFAVQDEVGPGARFSRQTNTSYTPHTDEPEVRRWTVRTELADQAQFESVEAVFAASKGGALPIEWTPPDESSAIDVLIVDYDPSASRPGLFTITMVLEEDF